MFRWREEADGSWVGVDGDWWYFIRRDGDRLLVWSNGDAGTLGRFFQLERSARAERARILELGPELADYLEACRGLRTVRYADPVECVFTFLCTANNHVARITAMVRWLADRGTEFADRPDLNRFPSLERLADLSEAELRAAGFGYRAATLPRVARELLSRGGDGYLNGLEQSSLVQARQELINLPGIGRKLADCIALFGLGFSEAAPVDTHIWRAATRIYFPHYDGQPLTPYKYEEFTAFFRARFREHAGWAHQALFYDGLLNWRNPKDGLKNAVNPGDACE